MMEERKESGINFRIARYLAACVFLFGSRHVIIS